MAMSGAKKIIHQNTRRRKGNNERHSIGADLGTATGKRSSGTPPGVGFQRELGLSASGHHLPLAVTFGFLALNKSERLLFGKQVEGEN